MTKRTIVQATTRYDVSAANAESLHPKFAAVLAIAFGSFLLFGAAFAQPAAIHDAAHDGRHSFAFPCH